MTDKNEPGTGSSPADDWADALAEQSRANPPTQADGLKPQDDWAAAMAEQTPPRRPLKRPPRQPPRRPRRLRPHPPSPPRNRRRNRCSSRWLAPPQARAPTST